MMVISHSARNFFVGSSVTSIIYRVDSVWFRRAYPSSNVASGSRCLPYFFHNHRIFDVSMFDGYPQPQHPLSRMYFCQAGVCTYEDGVLGTPILESISKLLDVMFQGLSVSTQVPSFSPCLTNRSRGIYVFDAKLFVDCTLTPHLKEAYHSRLDRSGDHICIFGFSCGVMTARDLTSMAQKVGLLPPCNLEQSPFAYATYARDDDAGPTFATPRPPSPGDDRLHRMMYPRYPRGVF